MLKALDQLLAGMRYEQYERTVTTASEGQGVADVHNLVTLSRYPVLNAYEIRHKYLPEIAYSAQTADPTASGSVLAP